MCLAVPGRVISVVGMTARVDFRGSERAALIDLLPDVRVGEYVLVHAGFVIQRLDAAEAAETFRLLEEVEAAAGEAADAGRSAAGDEDHIE